MESQSNTPHPSPQHTPRDRTDHPLAYASSYHAPVLCQAVIESLITDPVGVYVDGTLGGGGHSAALLDALEPGGRVIGIDQDPDALAAASARLADHLQTGRFRTIHGAFGSIEKLLADIGITEIDGFLLDLGVSSHQIDVPERGFSYQAEGVLDMRMNPEGGVTAGDIVNQWSLAEVREVLRRFGEEPRAHQIAQAILQARPLETTAQLAQVVRRVTPTREEVKTLSRVFQGLRIAVNAELDQLEQALWAGVRLIKPGGRMAIISYHSLEDRRAKRFFRFGNFEGEAIRDLYGHLQTPWHDLTRKAIQAESEEVAANPRARSARLRVAERIETPPGR